MDAVTAGLGPDVNHRGADRTGGGIEDAVCRRDADAHGVDQVVAVVAGMERRLAAHGGHTHAIAIAANAGHNTADQEAGFGMIGRTEAQHVHVGDGACAHGEDIAHDAAHACGRTLMRFDEAGVVVALHLEDGSLAVPDIDHAGILAGPADHPWGFGRQGL